MSMGILGRKVGMTRIFDPEDGTSIAVTVIEAGPCPVVQVKTPETDQYSAVQLGFGKRKRANRPLMGHFKKADVEPTRYLREFRVEDASSFQPGQVLTVTDLFSEGDRVDVTGLSKGRGFAGPMKRHGFKGGRDSHGGEKDHRRVGSIGASAFPSRVPKGRRMAGHMGVERVTVQNLRVVKTDPERHLLVVQGAVPGPKNGLLLIRKAVRTQKNA